MHLGGSSASVEGVLLGRSRGHYLLTAANVLQDAEASHDVGEVRIPVGRVLFYQVLDS